MRKFRSDDQRKQPLQAIPVALPQKAGSSRGRSAELLYEYPCFPGLEGFISGKTRGNLQQVPAAFPQAVTATAPENLWPSAKSIESVDQVRMG